MTKLKTGLIVALVGFVSVVGFYRLPKNDKTDLTTQKNETTDITESQSPTAEVKYLTLTGDEYKKLFLDSSHPNTKVIIRPPEITGDKAYDARIIALAEARGYELQEVPSSELENYDGDLMQQKLADAWFELQKQATENGISLKITSAMRTVEEQKQLFLERLGGAITDEQINQVLAMTAPPGYSRHHSGYVIDIADTSTAVFEYSPGYKWLSADNYLIPKKLGIIPSYPDGAKNQGPEPEPWEYVWVGQSLLTE